MLLSFLKLFWIRLHHVMSDANVKCKSVKKIINKRVLFLKSMKWLYWSGEMLVNKCKQQTHAKREEVGQVSTTDCPVSPGPKSE